MNFWKALGWFGAVAFVLILVVSWLANGHRESEASDGEPRPAPLIVR